MFLEKLFGNTFGLIWLIVFMAIVLGLIVFLFVKKEKNEKEIVGDEEKVERVVEETSTVEKEEKFEETVIDEVKMEENSVATTSEYEIIESEDGFFRVRKAGTERTLRKFATKEEAVEFVKQKENN